MQTKDVSQTSINVNQWKCSSLPFVLRHPFTYTIVSVCRTQSREDTSYEIKFKKGELSYICTYNHRSGFNCLDLIEFSLL